MDARLEVRTAEERLRAIAGRADALVATAAAERQAAQRPPPGGSAGSGRPWWPGRWPKAPPWHWPG